MRNLNSDQLSVLYINFCAWRDSACGGHARMTVSDFYDKHGLEPCTQDK